MNALWQTVPWLRTEPSASAIPSLLPLPSMSAFPEEWAGRLLCRQFRGLLSVYSNCSLCARRVANTTPYIEGSGGFGTSSAASIATSRSDPVPRRDLHLLLTSAFLQRTTRFRLRLPGLSNYINLSNEKNFPTAARINQNTIR